MIDFAMVAQVIGGISQMRTAFAPGSVQNDLMTQIAVVVGKNAFVRGQALTHKAVVTLRKRKRARQRRAYIQARAAQGGVFQSALTTKLVGPVVLCRNHANNGFTCS